MSDEVLQFIERRSQESIERTRRVLRYAGRIDLVVEMDKNLRDIALGIDGARATWNALSVTQRVALAKTATQPRIFQLWGNLTDYGYRTGSGSSVIVCKHRTIIPLAARGLLEALDDGLHSPKIFAATERARFVLKHGPRS